MNRITVYCGIENDHELSNLTPRQISTLPQVEPEDLRDGSEILVVTFDVGYGQMELAVIYFGDLGHYSVKFTENFSQAILEIWMNYLKSNESEFQPTLH